MAFIRVKRIKKKSGNSYAYAYLVENKWRKRPKTGEIGSRQKVKEYLGRVHSFDRKKEIGFHEHHGIRDVQEYVDGNSYQKVIEDLVKWEMERHGIAGFNVADSVRKEGERCVIKMNEGHMCDYTLRRLLGFVPTMDERADGRELARSMIEAGIAVPEEVFIALFNKMARAEEERVKIYY